MARGINKVILIGNLGQDPDVRYTQSGAAVTNLNLATSDTWNDKQSGQRQERTEWHRVVMFNKLAEVAQQYLRKGSRVYIEGRIQTRKWQGQDGQDRYSTEIVANDMQMLDTRSGQGSDSGYAQGASQGSYGSSSQSSGQRPDQGQQSQQDQGKSGSSNPQQGHSQQSNSQQNNQQGNNYGAPSPGSFDDFDDEIPF